MNYNLILSLLTITTNITLIFSVKMSRSIASQIKHAFIVAAGIVSILVVILANNFKFVMLAISIALVFTYMYHVELNQSIDGLTSLLNQQCFIHDLQKLHQKAVIIVLDVNDFKQINDTYGHQKGDEILHMLSAILKDNYQKHGRVYRMGGDEFSVILTRNISNSDFLNKNLIADIQKVKEQMPEFPYLSYGSAIYDPSSKELPEDALNKADSEMYYFKRLMKGKI